MSNYISKEVHGAKCAHTIGTETGEVASVAIVPDVGQQYYAHQAEQFSRRLNVNPIVHVSDICPKGTKLWKKLMSKGSFTIICCLGWFHFLQRITKTLFEEHRHYKAAIHRLRECLYWFDTGDLEKVTRQIAAGNLGRMDGEICPEEKRTEKAKDSQGRRSTTRGQWGAILLRIFEGTTEERRGGWCDIWQGDKSMHVQSLRWEKSVCSTKAHCRRCSSCGTITAEACIASSCFNSAARRTGANIGSIGAGIIGTTSFVLWHANLASYYCPAATWAIHTVDKGRIQ
jgi:hypothetical protein